MDKCACKLIKKGGKTQKDYMTEKKEKKKSNSMTTELKLSR